MPEQLPNALDRAIRVAQATGSPIALIIPAEVRELPHSAPTHDFTMVPSSPPGSELARGAEVINAGSKVAVLVGQGARSAAPQVRALAEATGAGGVKALLGKDVLPYVTGSIGLPATS